MTDECISILRAMVILRPMSAPEFEELHPHYFDAKANMQALGKAGYLDSHFRPSLATLWSINSKGRRYLAQLDSAGGQIAGPREGIPAGQYRGEKPIHTRAGAMDAFALPSLWNGESTERKRPLIVGARVEPVGGRGWV